MYVISCNIYLSLCVNYMLAFKDSAHKKRENIKYLNSFSCWLHDKMIIFWCTGLNNTLLKLLKLVSPCFSALDNILSLINMLLGLFSPWSVLLCLEWAARTLAILYVPTFYICWTAPVRIFFLRKKAHTGPKLTYIIIVRVARTFLNTEEYVYKKQLFKHSF